MSKSLVKAISESNPSVIPRCRRHNTRAKSVKLLLHRFAMRLEWSAWLLNRKANTHCVGSVALSSCRGACRPTTARTHRGPSTLATTTSRAQKRRVRPERDHERFDSCWFAFARLPYRSLSLLRETDKNTMGLGYLGSADAFSLPERYNFSARFKRPIHFGPRHSFTGLVSRRTVGETGNRFL